MILVINWLSRIFLVFICLNSVFLDSLDIWMHSTLNVFRVQNILASGNNTNISGHLQGNTSFNSRLQKKRQCFSALHRTVFMKIMPFLGGNLYLVCSLSFDLEKAGGVTWQNCNNYKIRPVGVLRHFHFILI